MLDYLVLYNSQSGNTKSVAAAIFSALPEGSRDLIDIDSGSPSPRLPLILSASAFTEAPAA